MIILIIGIVFILFAVFACLPFLPLAWGADVLTFLRGSIPVFAIVLGLIGIFIGSADIRDKANSKKEEAQEKEATKH